jgi:cytochrome P450
VTQNDANSGCPTAGRESDWDPTAPETFDSPHVLYEELRRTNPLPWSNEFGGFWAAMTFEDVETVATRSDLFTTTVQNVVPHVPRKRPRPPLHVDPPQHALYRQPLDRVFRKRVLGRLREQFSASAQRLVEPIVETGQGDFSREVALPYAVECFAIFLGVPSEQVVRIREVGVEYSFAIQDMAMDRIGRASEELYVIAHELVAERVTNPLDPDLDMISSLLRASEQDPGPAPDTIVDVVRQIIVAGVGAPHAALGSAVVHLAREPEVQSQLRNYPSLLPRAIEELLRLYAPYRVFARTARQDVTLAGETITAGEAVTMIFPSANRDEAVFERPHEFDMSRSPNNHLAFGRGTHRCPGAAMARMQMHEMIKVLLTGTSEFGLSGEVEMFNWLEFGPRSSPMWFKD